jgi:DNA-binding NtrC family response regulator
MSPVETPRSHSDVANVQSTAPQLLLVDDDPLIIDALSFVLEANFQVHCAASRDEARSVLQQSAVMPDLALIDLGLPPSPHTPESGFRLIEELLSLNPNMKVLVLSGQSERDNVRHALSLGAVDFIPKPCDPDLLNARLRHQIMMLEAEQEPQRVAEQDEILLGASPAMNQLRDQIQRYTDTPFPVLILGESGTGKELVADSLHRMSEHSDQPLLTVNCAAFTPELLESQLFGHAKGAFTGASSAHAGFFEITQTGSLFLDEIGDFPLVLQPKLLRVLENGEYYRLGETRVRTSGARIIAATNADLQSEIRDGRFRQDLFHRLSVLTIEVPPLRSRGDDRFTLLDHFRSVYAAKVAPFRLDDAAQERWLAYSFPGNVRELRNIVIRLGAKYPGALVGLAELEMELDSTSEMVDGATLIKLHEEGFQLDAILNHWEQRYIDAALRLSAGNLSEAARLLGVNRTTLYSKIQRLAKDSNGDHN